MAGKGTRRHTAMFASRASILVFCAAKADPRHRVASRPRISRVGAHIGPSESRPCGCESCLARSVRRACFETRDLGGRASQLASGTFEIHIFSR